MMLFIPFVLLIPSCICFRSFGGNFTKANTYFSCPEYHFYQPDLFPHTCVGYLPICQGVTEVTVKIFNFQEVLCHPRFQAFNLMPSTTNIYILRCISPYSTTYQYNQNGEVVYTCELTYNAYCILAQKYGSTIKCEYCFGYLTKTPCDYIQAGIMVISISPPVVKQCPLNCKRCDVTTLYCSECLDGYTKSDLSDTKCSYKCKTEDMICTYIPLTSTYVTNWCSVGYEMVFPNGIATCQFCVAYCILCANKICSLCDTGYQLISGKCFGDPNCAASVILYNSNNSPTGFNCLQCDFGYFQNGPLCQLCSSMPGLETCFLCNSGTECKTCQSGYYLNDQKICTPFDGCDGRCNTCLITDPFYCTTCDYLNLKRVTVNGKCLCAQAQNYAERFGSCVLCTEGFCKTCTLDFFECTSCDPARNRGLVGTTCPCLQGYYETYLDDMKCQKCHETCYNCDNPTKNDCTECDSLKNRYLFQGQCICKRGYVETLQGGALLCLGSYISLIEIACHPRCEKCSKPKDATPNQYCTLCIAGQNRMLTNTQSCDCMNTYGDLNGVQDICFQCYYTCGGCLNDQPTGCTMCLASSNRYLTSTKECVCKDNYFEDGVNNRDCKKNRMSLFLFQLQQQFCH
ncbi:unnamed protein product [Paramecium octaurelia]|uniref:Uncharacterized protein n=1 Tax=Paramecium octaurelia TaxID=43137 RepID=A0A8S1TMK8_PAROT|nr:unnamed protein product [Paramecium octaurelia]